jgi:hypothetical protein
MHIKIIKLGFLLALNLFSLGHLFSQDKLTQQLFVHLENTNILVRGLENPIQISSKMGGDYFVTTKSAAIIKKSTENEYTIDPKNLKEDTLMVEVISKKDPKIKTFVKFKIIDVPLPRIKFGGINPGLSMSKWSIMHQPQLNAVCDNFFIDGIRYKVISYSFNYFDYSQGIRKIQSIKVIGNSLEKIKAIIRSVDVGEKLEFSDIQVETASGIVSVGNIIISFK